MPVSAEANVESSRRAAPIESSEVTTSQKEAVGGLEDFSNIESSMRTGSEANETVSSKFDGDNAFSISSVNDTDDSSNDGESKNNNEFKRVPGQLEDAPHMTPNEFQNWNAEKNFETIDEHGNVYERVEKPEALESEISASVDESGRLKNVETDMPNDEGNVSFELSEGGVTRTSKIGEMNDVTKFGTNGKPESRTVDAPGFDKPVAIEPEPDDRVTANTDDDGNTKIRSVDGVRDNTTSLVVDNNGIPQSRTIEEDGSTLATQFNPDGTPKAETRTDFDRDGKKVSEQTATEDTYDRRDYDSNGNVVKSLHESNGRKIESESREDGSAYSHVSEDDGSTTSTFYAPDGTETQLSHDGLEETSMKVRRPDGSVSVSVSDADAITQTDVDKDGNWRQHRRDNATGQGETSIGHGDETYLKENSTAI